VSYWRLDDGSGTVAADVQGANPGTYTGGAGVTLGSAGATTDSDTAITLDGSTGYVSVPDAASLHIVGDITIEAWVHPTDLLNFNMIVTKDLLNVARPYEFRLDQTTGKAVLLNQAGVAVTATTGVAAGAWTHVAVTVAAGTATHYLNGAANGTGASSASTDGGGPLLIGARADLAASQKFKGIIDEVAIYNSALSVTRLLAHFNAR